MKPRHLLCVLALLGAERGSAHDGPPYPVLVDEQLAGWTVSVWADPDVGTGTFYVYLDPPTGASPSDVRLEVISVDALHGSPDTSGCSTLAEPREPFQQIVLVEYAHQGPWPTRFVLRPARGGEALGALHFDLEVTPPGLGTFNLIWYAIPFLAVGVLWFRALVAQRAHDRAPTPTGPLP